MGCGNTPNMQCYNDGAINIKSVSAQIYTQPLDLEVLICNHYFIFYLYFISHLHLEIFDLYSLALTDMNGLST